MNQHKNNLTGTMQFKFKKTYFLHYSKDYFWKFYVIISVFFFFFFKERDREVPQK